MSTPINKYCLKKAIVDIMIGKQIKLGDNAVMFHNLLPINTGVFISSLYT